MTEADIDEILGSSQIVSRVTKLREKGFLTIELPRPSAAEYHLQCFLAVDGEPQISATRVGGQVDEYFWYLPFERASYATEPERTTHFHASLTALINSPSRIRQRRGMLLWHFEAEVHDHESWRGLGGTSVLKPANVPRISGKERLYQSPPLRDGG